MTRPAPLRVRFARFDWEERRALAEALVLLVLAAAAVRLLPLALIGRIATAGPRACAPLGHDRAEVLTWMVGWAVDRAARRSPLRAKCFEQGLAAQVMLRRRGIDSTMFYGVGRGTSTGTDSDSGSGGIRAHVWIETDRFAVIGTPAPGEFAVLATWPEGRHAGTAPLPGTRPDIGADIGPGAQP